MMQPLVSPLSRVLCSMSPYMLKGATHNILNINAQLTSCYK